MTPPTDAQVQEALVRIDGVAQAALSPQAVQEAR